jgi:hypothetical protein
MTKRFAACLLLALVVVGVAAAGRGDPQKQFTAADQARAKAMLLRKADFGPGWKASKPSDEEDDFYCEALDESDLVLTGEGESLDFEKESSSPPAYLLAGSLSYVYETAAQSAASWRRGTSAAALRCMQREYRRLAKEEGMTFVSLRRIAFPRVAAQMAAFRIKLKVEGVPWIVDFVMMRDGRAQAGPVVGGMPSAFPRAEEVRLAKIVADRMAEAMRGA